MGWEFWVNVALVLITISSFIVTAVVYHRQNNILISNSRVTNFYSLLSYLKDAKYFNEKGEVIANIPVTTDAIIFSKHVLTDSNLISEQYINKKIDKQLFESKLRKNLDVVTENIFGRINSDNIDYKIERHYLFNKYKTKIGTIIM